MWVTSAIVAFWLLAAVAWVVAVVRVILALRAT